MTRLIATFFYVGYLTPAPGTWGSLAALPVALLLYWLGGPWLVLATTILVIMGGFWAVAAETRTGPPDPSHIVIDEVAGMWIALLPVFIGAAHAQVGVLALWPGWIAAFVLFRLFDIWKPGPVGWADRLPGPPGVMLDDLIAGLMAGIGMALMAGLWHGVMRL